MNILDRIFNRKREFAAERYNVETIADLKARALDAPPTLGFHQALRNSSHPVALIAEIKKASPSKGVIREDFDPVEIAACYGRVGADCISVLTDEEDFQGHADYLLHAKSECLLPALRKDFTVHEADVYESRAMGADAVLLIVNGLTVGQLTEYRELAESLNMDAVVEVHTVEEAEVAVSTGAKLIAVNNRDLATFQTSLETGESIMPLLRGKALLIAESALSAPADIARMGAAGAQAVLIGTAFCERPDVEEAVRDVMGWR